MKLLLAIVGSLNLAVGAAIVGFPARISRLLDAMPAEPALFLQTAGALVLLIGLAFWIASQNWRRHRGALLLAVAMQVCVVVLALSSGAVARLLPRQHTVVPLAIKPVSVNLPLRAGPITSLATEPAFPFLRFTDPTFITPIPDGTGRMLVVERPGRIVAFKSRIDAADKKLWLDITDRTMQVANRAEDGLFCIAFHPEFANADSAHAGEFFLHYTANIDGQRFNRLSKLRVPPGSKTADASTEVVLIDTPDENQSHNGGTVTFGPDGFLYLALGDDGKRYPNPHAQNIRGELLSGILRIDPDCRGGDISHPPPRQPTKGKTAHYYIPSDNPFVGQPNALEEFYAIGFRNPWRMSFDPSGRLWVSDVGNLRREEINLVEKGSNGGWAYAEGTLLCKSYDADAPDKPQPYLGKETWPLYEYERDAMNRCVIGGYVYRGSQFPELKDKYVYADQSGRIYALELGEKDEPPKNELIAVIDEPGLGVSSLGEDADGELLICIIKDLAAETAEIHRLVRPRVDPAQQMPQWLSETKLFDDLPSLKPAAGFIPFEVNTPLWSDRAIKHRWIGLPEGARIEGELTDTWKFPPGTVFIKHFDLPLDESIQNSHFSGAAEGKPTQQKIRRLETRIVVCDDRGAVYAATYRWKPDLTDAELVNFSQTEDIEYIEEHGQRQTQKWLYPGRFECLTCHNAPAGYVLGFNAKQLNRDVSFDGCVTNQLRRFIDAKLIDVAASRRELAAAHKLAAIDDPHASLEHRARSYLDSNCSSCHRPGHRFGAWDARLEAPLSGASIVNAKAYMHHGGSKLARIIRGGDLENSFLWLRLTSDDTTQKMPPLGRNVVDRRAAETLAEWIETLPQPTAEDDARLEEEHR